MELRTKGLIDTLENYVREEPTHVAVQLSANYRPRAVLVSGAQKQAVAAELRKRYGSSISVINADGLESQQIDSVLAAGAMLVETEKEPAAYEPNTVGEQVKATNDQTNEDGTQAEVEENVDEQIEAVRRESTGEGSVVVIGDHESSYSDAHHYESLEAFVNSALDTFAITRAGETVPGRTVTMREVGGARFMVLSESVVRLNKCQHDANGTTCPECITASNEARDPDDSGDHEYRGDFHSAPDDVVEAKDIIEEESVPEGNHNAKKWIAEYYPPAMGNDGSIEEVSEDVVEAASNEIPVVSSRKEIGQLEFVESERPGKEMTVVVDRSILL